MAKQIDILADWATSAASYGNYAIKPSTAKRLAGWTGGATPDVPPAPHINWLHKTAYENVGWLIDNVLFADTARWEQMPLTATGTFPTSASNMRFYFGNTLDSDFNEGAIAYDGASGFMAIGNAYNVGAIAGAATGYVWVSRDAGRSYVFNQPTALSAGALNGITYDSVNGRFFGSFSQKGAGAGSVGIIQYTSDYGATWSQTTFSTTSFSGWKAPFFWKQTGRYMVFNASNPIGLHTSASGTITGAYTVSNMTTGDLIQGHPRFNSRYMIFGAQVFPSTTRKLYYSSSATPGTLSQVTMNSGPLNQINGSIQVFYFPHNDTFVVPLSGAFVVLDGVTGNPGTHANWTPFIPTFSPALSLTNAVTWMYYDTKRSMYYLLNYNSAGGTGAFWACPTLGGEWKQLPGPIVGGINQNSVITKILGSSYLTEYFTAWQGNTSDTSVVLQSQVYTLMAGQARRAFPALY